MALAEVPPQTTFLIHFGELGLKGRNQPKFRRQLRRNLRLKLRAAGCDWPVRDAVGVLTVEVPAGVPEATCTEALAALRQVFGIVWITRARRFRPLRFSAGLLEQDLQSLERHVIDLANAQFVPEKSFCVRVNRGNKALPFRSPELAARLGLAIREHTRWERVDLTQPDVTFHLDARPAGTYLFGEKLAGPGGLPVGTAGRVLALLSGGIDSPVAAYLLAKRGCRVDFVYFTADSVAEDKATGSKMWRLAKQLNQFTLGSRLVIVPYVHFDLALLRKNLGYDLILFRRFMVRVAARLAGRFRASALVTGDTLSQVASQTLSNLISTSHATELPVLRPLIGFDKQETIALAERIGTYAISIEPHKDCCALVSEHPKTRSRDARLADLEAEVFPDYQRLIDRTLAESEELAFRVVEPAVAPPQSGDTVAGARPESCDS